VDGETLSGLDLSGTTHTDAGDYLADAWTYTDVTGNYNDVSGTVDDSIANANATCTVTPYDATYDGEVHTATGSCLGVVGETLVGLDLSGTTHTDAGTYAGDLWIFTDGTGNYNDDSGRVDDSIAKADAVCTITPYAVTYDGSSHTATGSCLGVDGETLSGLDLSGTNHTDAGDYLADAWTFTDLTGNYNDDSGTVDDSIARANATCAVTPYSVTFDGSSHTATGSCLGVDGETLAGLDLSGTNHTDASTYDGDLWTFTDVTGNYNDDSGTVDDSIAKANATCAVTPYAVTYDGEVHTATGFCLGVDGETLSGLDLSGTNHTDAGDYLADAWTFTDVTGYYADTSGTVDDSIRKADAACTVNSYTVTYDGAAHTATGSCLGVEGETLAGLDLSGTTHIDAGDYLAYPWTFTDETGNYNDDSGTVDDSINPKEASVTPDAAGKTYGNLDPTLTGTLAGFLDEDGVEASYSREPGETVAGNPYEITAVLSPTEVLSNYDITYNTADFTIDPKEASVIPDAAGKTYGDLDPAITGTLAGFLEADGVEASYSREPGETVAGSPYAITAVLSPTEVLSNYDITYNTANFTIDPKEASVIPDAAGKTYGYLDPTLTGTLAGFLEADGVEASYSREPGETVAGNPYEITAVLSPTEVLNNYDITYNTADFTIDKRSIEVTADAQSKVYGDSDPELTYQVTSGSLAFGDTFSGTLTRESGEVLGIYAITQGTLALSDNYDVTFIGADFTINKRSVEVTADAQSKEYGDSDPELTYQVTSGSLIPGDVFTGTLERQSGEDVGTYAITQGTLALTDNYDLSFFSADLTITLRPITVTADPQTKAYGDPDPVLTYQITSGSLLPGDVFTGALYRELGEDVGMYAITQGSLALPVYYDLSYAGNYLTITGGIRVKLFLPIIIEQPH
jgi:hypothetical protein